MEWYDWQGKKIFVKLKDGAVYSGLIRDVMFLGKNQFDVDLYMIEITDKFGSKVCFSSSEIAKIKEENFKEN